MSRIAGKRERVEQLSRLGFNVPKMLRIPAGTVLDATWLARMEQVRNGDPLMTVRSYHPMDEIRYTQGPFYPERPAGEAISLARATLREWNVLWQEAIPVEKTVLCGDILVLQDGSGWIEAARGPGFRVRDIHEAGKVPDHLRVALSFTDDTHTGDPDIDLVIQTAREAAKRIRHPNGVVFEFNVQENPVGIKRERLLFWEWRPVVSSRKKAIGKYEFPAVIEDSRIWCFGKGTLSALVELPGPGTVGSKGSNLLLMSSIGVPVPSGFVIPISICQSIAAAQKVPETVRTQIAELLKKEVIRNGDLPLFSVRSSPSVSLPGLLKTVINVGLNGELLREIAQTWLLEARRMLIEGFLSSFTAASSSLTEGDVREIIEPEREETADPIEWLNKAKGLLAERGVIIPNSMDEQLISALLGVVQSAQAIFAQREGFDKASMAVIVQRMVFGIADNRSGTGVIFTRNPNTGDSNPIVEFLPQAQGPEIVSGQRTPVGLSDLRVIDPQIPIELIRWAKEIERRFGDMQEIEFTVDSGQLWFLQTRSGTRSDVAAVRIAYTLFQEGVIDERTARRLLGDIELSDVMQQCIISSARPIAQGVSASLGVAIGKAAFLKPGKPLETGPIILIIDHFAKGLELLEKVTGIIALHGGTTSHGVVLARSLGIPVIVRVPDSSIHNNCVNLGHHMLSEGELITIDGFSGQIFMGALQVEERPVPGLNTEILQWWGTERGERGQA